jgi:phosphoribosyl 1,2-cyclic phosphate phosphodiesterase
MRVTLLGTGTSTGVPMIGCECSVCTSADSRDRRLRTSALIETSTGNILIDAGPDMRYQLLRAGVQSLHGVLITHEHQDHIGGIDDLRPLNYRMQTSVALYSAEHTLAILRKRYHYAFEAQSGGSSRPNIDLIPINPWQPFQLAAQTIIPLPITHGPMNILGYRIGQFAYITDASHIDDSVVDAFRASMCSLLTHFVINHTRCIYRLHRPKNTSSASDHGGRILCICHMICIMLTFYTACPNTCSLVMTVN